MPEKLLTTKEASELLGISEEKLKGLVKKGEFPAYKVGGQYLRFRREQIEAIQNEISIKFAKKPPQKPAKEYPKTSSPVVAFNKVLFQERWKNRDVAYSQSALDRFLDFIYFNDFYIISAGIALLILWVIFQK